MYSHLFLNVIHVPFVREKLHFALLARAVSNCEMVIYGRGVDFYSTLMFGNFPKVFE